MKQPVASVQEIHQGEPELSFFAPVVMDLHNQQVFLDLVPSPDFLYAAITNRHAVLLVELFVRENSFFIDHHKPLVPVSKHLGFLIQFPHNESIGCQRFRHPWHFFYDALFYLRPLQN